MELDQSKTSRETEVERQAFVADKKAIILIWWLILLKKNIKLTYEKLSTEQSTILHKKNKQ
jgi:hypothetical protein